MRATRVILCERSRVCFIFQRVRSRTRNHFCVCLQNKKTCFISPIRQKRNDHCARAGWRMRGSRLDMAYLRASKSTLLQLCIINFGRHDCNAIIFVLGVMVSCVDWIAQLAIRMCNTIRVNKYHPYETVECVLFCILNFLRSSICRQNFAYRPMNRCWG